MSESTEGLRPLRVLRAGTWWILVVTLVVTAGAWLVASASRPSYVAVASVVLEPKIVANTTPVSPAMGTEKQLVSSGVVLDQVARVLLLSPTALVKAVAVSVPPDANVLNISCQFGDPLLAQRCANLMASYYVAYRNESSSTSNGSGLRATLVTQASRPTTPESNSRPVTVSIGVIVGLLLGVGSAFLRDMVSPRLRGSADFTARTGAPVLTVVPRVRKWRTGVGAEYASRMAADSALTESYRYLRTGLLTRVGDLSGKVILVTSAEHGEGRSSVAANLGTALARSGMGVLLVDADPLRPAQHRIFGTDPSTGFPEMIGGGVALADISQPSSIPGLRVVAGSRVHPDAADLLSSSRAQQAIAQLRRSSDVVVIDSGPLLRVADAAALAPLSDVVLLVADSRSSTKDAVTAAARQLGELEVPLFGILNAVTVRRGEHVVVAGRERPRFWRIGRSSRRHVTSGGWFPAGATAASAASAASAARSHVPSPALTAALLAVSPAAAPDGPDIPDEPAGQNGNPRFSLVVGRGPRSARPAGKDLPTAGAGTGPGAGTGRGDDAGPGDDAEPLPAAERSADATAQLPIFSTPGYRPGGRPGR